MNILRMLTSNYIINVGVTSWFCAQVLKTLFTLIATKKLDLERMVGAGGMPSSHSALTISVAMGMARKLGFNSPEFGLALTLATVVMYDAMGVRRAAGEQAKVLNKMLFEFSSFPFFGGKDKKGADGTRGDKQLGDGGADKADDAASTGVAVNVQADGGEPGEDGAQRPALVEKELKEFLGHTPLEVLGGVLLGILVSVFLPVV